MNMIVMCYLWELHSEMEIKVVFMVNGEWRRMNHSDNQFGYYLNCGVCIGKTEFVIEILKKCLTIRMIKDLHNIHQNT